MRIKRIKMAIGVCLFVISLTGCEKKGEPIQVSTAFETKTNQEENISQQADESFDDGNYQNARELYTKAGLQDKIKECTYLIAKKYLEDKEYQLAIEEFETITEYKDVDDLLKDVRYQYALALYDKSHYDDAIKQLEPIEDYKDTKSYLDKCKIERKYEKFDYDNFFTIDDESSETMTQKEIRDYIESYLQTMYTTWYWQSGGDEKKDIVIDPYTIDGKEYRVLFWGGQGKFTEFDICYLGDETSKQHVSIAPDFANMNGNAEMPFRLGIGDVVYSDHIENGEQEIAQWEEDVSSENIQTKDYYLPDTVVSGSLTTEAHFAHWGYSSSLDKKIVMVNCTVTNSSDDNLWFVASDYFSLNNHGVITYALANEYDNSTLAPGGKFNTEIAFICQDVSRTGDIAYMDMNVENVQVHLKPAPQTDEKWHQLAGTYMSSSTSFDSIYIITALDESEYYVVWVSDALGSVNQYTATLDKKNRISIGNSDYLWNPEDGGLSLYDEIEGEYNTEYSYRKQNPSQ